MNQNPPGLFVVPFEKVQCLSLLYMFSLGVFKAPIGPAVDVVCAEEAILIADLKTSKG